MTSASRKFKKRQQQYQKQQIEEYSKFFALIVAERKFVKFLLEVVGESDSKYFEWYVSVVQFLMNFGSWEDETGFTSKLTVKEFETQFTSSYENMKKMFDKDDKELDEVMKGLLTRFIANAKFAEEEK